MRRSVGRTDATSLSHPRVMFDDKKIDEIVDGVLVRLEIVRDEQWSAVGPEVKTKGGKTIVRVEGPPLRGAMKAKFIAHALEDVPTLCKIVRDLQSALIHERAKNVKERAAWREFAEALYEMKTVEERLDDEEGGTSMNEERRADAVDRYEFARARLRRCVSGLKIPGPLSEAEELRANLQKVRDEFQSYVHHEHPPKDD